MLMNSQSTHITIHKCRVGGCGIMEISTPATQRTRWCDSGGCRFGLSPVNQRQHSIVGMNEFSTPDAVCPQSLLLEGGGTRHETRGAWGRGTAPNFKLDIHRVSS